MEIIIPINQFNTLLIIIVIALTMYLLYLNVRNAKNIEVYRKDIARNLHDETGPMLLYAKILAKKQEEVYDKSLAKELNSHLSVTIDAIRGLSHDILSNKFLTIDCLLSETGALLSKLQTHYDFDYDIIHNAGKKSISNFKYIELKNILNELITNSIKHKECFSIVIEVAYDHHQLIVTYTDEGVPVAVSNVSNGLGFQNITHRIQKLNGQLLDHQKNPTGYYFKWSVPVKS